MEPMQLSKLPIQFDLGGRRYAEHADNGPEWGLLFTATCPFPI